MSAIETSTVTLRIYGDDLIPQEITKLLGVSPTHAVTKGQEIVVRKTGKVRIAKSGMWSLCASDREPEDLDGQIREIFSRITADVAVWQSITKKYRVNLFCGLFMSEANDGLVFPRNRLQFWRSEALSCGLIFMHQQMMTTRRAPNDLLLATPVPAQLSLLCQWAGAPDHVRSAKK